MKKHSQTFEAYRVSYQQFNFLISMIGLPFDLAATSS